MRQRLKHRTKKLESKIWALTKGSSALPGSCATLAIIACGRHFFSFTTSTLSGWSALFMLSVFTGLAIANLRRTSPFAGIAQTIVLLTGCLTCLGSLVSLNYQHAFLSDILLMASFFLLLPCAFSIRLGSDVQKQEPEQFLVIWAHRLDSLTKYELPHELKNGLSCLIDTLWHSPPNQAEFIPAQTQVFESEMSELENSVREKNFVQSIKILEKLSSCIEERNKIMQRLNELHCTKTKPPLC